MSMNPFYTTPHRRRYETHYNIVSSDNTMLFSFVSSLLRGSTEHIFILHKLLRLIKIVIKTIIYTIFKYKKSNMCNRLKKKNKLAKQYLIVGGFATANWVDSLSVCIEIAKTIVLDQSEKSAK